VESAVLRRLKLLNRLQDVHLRPEEAQALMQRVETNTSSAADRDLLAQVIRATTQVSAQLLVSSPQPEPPLAERPSPQRKAKHKRQLAKAARRRNRC
jgi:DNA-binding transcriptional MerR regulator